MLPQAGKSPLVYFETSLSAVFWDTGNLTQYRVLTRARIRVRGQPSTSISVQGRVRIRYRVWDTCVRCSLLLHACRFFRTAVMDLRWLLLTPALAMSLVLLFLLGFPSANLLPVTLNTKRRWIVVSSVSGKPVVACQVAGPASLSRQVTAAQEQLLWAMRPSMVTGLDDDVGIVSECLEPTTSKGLTKDGCRVFLTYVSQSVTNVLCTVSTELSIFALKHQFHLVTWQ